MANESLVTREQLSATASRTDDISADVSGRQQTLRGEVEGMRLLLRGAAGTKFQLAAADLDASLTQILNALNTMSAHVKTSITDYGTSDETNAEAIGNVQASADIPTIPAALRG